MTNRFHNFLHTANEKQLSALSINIASPASIRSWSHGEIRKPETINYRTFKPERGGLFCSKIFGPIKDYECLCGKYKKMKYRGVVCEKCGVEVTLSKVRRERMGHIELACPLTHIWFLKSLPSRIGLMLDKTLHDIDRILNFDAYIVSDPGITMLQQGHVLSEQEYQNLQEEYGGEFTVQTGALAIHSLLASVDLEKEITDLQDKISQTNADTSLKRLYKRLKLAKSFLDSGARPEWMVMTVLPVLPPDLRPLVPLEGGRFATSDLNDLYRRVINRNNRLKRLQEINAPDIIMRNEQRMLQESVDKLLDSSRYNNTVVNKQKQQPKSLADMLRGKQGRFRQNLLGKRVDYSGRSVIVVGPTLKLHQCGLPKKMAKELFKPFIMSGLQKLSHVPTLKVAKQLVEMEAVEVWDILAEVIREYPILLNRAPTLHRLSIQAFEPVLTEGKAIELHPLVCKSFNADFDGDQMAVHVPLTVEAQLEARVLMMSTNNILSPANGKPIIQPTQDIVFGLYYMTYIQQGEAGEGTLFTDIDEIHRALLMERVSLHSQIKLCIQMPSDENNEQAPPKMKIIDTTVGRALILEILPQGVDIHLANCVLDQKAISRLIDHSYRVAGMKQTVILADRLMSLGFRYATRSGLSIAIADFVIPDSKKDIIQHAEEHTQLLQKQYESGLITASEKHNKVIDLWMNANDTVGKSMMEEMSHGIHKTPEGEMVTSAALNSVYMCVVSGARGSLRQTQQAGGMRGLMAQGDGSIVDIPIKSNFREGLSVLEYFISIYGARKGLTDTALKTAYSGYFTRRLVDVGQDLIVTEDDCGTEKGLLINPLAAKQSDALTMSERVNVIGRVVATDVLDHDKNIIIPKGTLIDEQWAELLVKERVHKICIRSPIRCATQYGICTQCYGNDLGTGRKIDIGEAVGIIAAQSIGEPGTQLTLQTFHGGGTAASSATSIKADVKGIVHFENAVLGVSLEPDKDGLRVTNYGVRVTDPKESNFKKGEIIRREKVVEYSRKVVITDPGETTYTKGDIIDRLEIEENNKKLKKKPAQYTIRRVGFESVKPSLCIKSGKSKNAKILNQPNTNQPARYDLAQGILINVEEGASVGVNDILAFIPDERKNQDIVGGVFQVVNLFEARTVKDKEKAVFAPLSGTVSFGKETVYKRKLIITPEDVEDAPSEILLAKRELQVVEGDYVEKGDIIAEGKVDLHDVLSVKGVEELALYFTGEIQSIYQLEGVSINEKHIEVILRQMLRKVEIIDSGDSSDSRFLCRAQVDYSQVFAENNRLAKEGKEKIQYKRILLGIRKAALATESFISAASFQETNRVLTEAAVSGKVDKLRGLKENVSIGKLIPAGTGYVVRQQHVADKEDASLGLEAALSDALNDTRS